MEVGSIKWAGFVPTGLSSRNPSGSPKASATIPRIAETIPGSQPYITTAIDCTESYLCIHHEIKGSHQDRRGDQHIDQDEDRRAELPNFEADGSSGIGPVPAVPDPTAEWPCCWPAWFALTAQSPLSYRPLQRKRLRISRSKRRGTHQLAFRLISMNVLLGAKNVFTRRCGSERPGPVGLGSGWLHGAGYIGGGGGVGPVGELINHPTFQFVESYSGLWPRDV